MPIPKALGALMASVQKVANAVRKAFGAEGMLIQQFNEPAAGQTVFHLHFHVLPRSTGVPLRPHTGKMADHALLAEHAAEDPRRADGLIKIKAAPWGAWLNSLHNTRRQT